MNKKFLYKTMCFADLMLGFCLLVLSDPLKENYSSLTNHMTGYIPVLLLGAGTGLCLGLLKKKMEHSWSWWMIIGPILGTVVPYDGTHIGVLANLHIILAYVGFISMILSVFVLLKSFASYDLSAAHRLGYLYEFILFACMLIYMQSMVVNTLMEFLFLFVMILICLHIYDRIDKD